MYAVVRSGGKQLRVTPGDVVRVERIAGAVGDRVELGQVLLVAGEGEPRIGRPHVEGARVLATIAEQGRGPKIRVFKLRRRENYRRRIGHRQGYTALRVESIEG